jgi:hypothetical protein
VGLRRCSCTLVVTLSHTSPLTHTGRCATHPHRRTDGSLGHGSRRVAWRQQTERQPGVSTVSLRACVFTLCLSLRWRCRHRLRPGVGLGNSACHTRGPGSVVCCCSPSRLYARRSPADALPLHPLPRCQGWGSKIIDTKQSFPRKAGESFLESAHAAAASAMGALNPDPDTSSSKQRLLR